MSGLGLTRSYFMLVFENNFEHLRDKSINYRELITIVIFVCTWGRHFNRRGFYFTATTTLSLTILLKEQAAVQI